MTASQDDLIEFLVLRGAREVAHSKRSLLDHLLGVYEVLRLLECEEWLCRAGLFHSIYGTSKFQTAVVELSERGLIRSLIGERAESLVFLYCRVSKDSFVLSVLGQGQAWLADRDSGQTLAMKPGEFHDLMWLQLADGLEQYTRLGGESVNQVIFSRLASRLGSHATAALSRFQVFAQVPTTSVSSW